MLHRKIIGALLLLLAAATGAGREPPGAGNVQGTAGLPGDSLYQLPMTLTTSTGRSLQLAELRGAPLIVTMFYSSCTSVCPLLTTGLQHIVKQLSPRERALVHVLMVSFDSARDTPQSLAAFASEHAIHEKTWLLARAPASDVRALAAALGIQYRELADHSFNHSAVITVADQEGVVRARSEDFADQDGALLRALRAQLGGARGNR